LHTETALKRHFLPPSNIRFFVHCMNFCATVKTCEYRLPSDVFSSGIKA